MDHENGDWEKIDTEETHDQIAPQQSETESKLEEVTSPPKETSKIQQQQVQIEQETPKEASTETPKEIPQEKSKEMEKETPKEVTEQKQEIPQSQNLHLVDEGLKLSDQLQNYMEQKWHLANAGNNYHYVAVFGSQSTGKSTLLNLLFGTKFDVMQETKRQQTTKGLWLSISQPNILVMDVEGTDGRERGEDQDMERKSAVFSLAVSQVLIINMFEHDVGRYNGANYGLLKTVFDVNLQLFQAHREESKQKTLLLFVIRDHAQTPLESLSQILKADLQKIWSELSKPQEFKNSTIEEFFDLQFTALAHKVFLPDKFKEGVDGLRQWFFDEKSPNYVFKPTYAKEIPADGLYKFVSDIWERIMSNKDLDLPTQKELLAQFRCDELANMAFQKVGILAKQKREIIDKGELILNLGQEMKESKAEALKQYHESAHRYVQTIFEKVKNNLNEKIDATFYPLYTGQIRNLLTSYQKSFANRLDTKLKRGDIFIDAVHSVQQEVLGDFKNCVEEMTLEGTDWNYTARLDELEKLLQTEADNRKQSEIQTLKKQHLKGIQNHLLEPVSKALGDAKDDMWKEVNIAIEKTIQNTESWLNLMETQYGFSKEEIQREKKQMLQHLLEEVISKVQAELQESVFCAKLKRKFELVFKFDNAHRPKIWKSVEEITARFDEAKLKANTVLNLFTLPDQNLDLKSLDPDYVQERFITEDKKRSYWERFELEANALFQEAVNSTNNALHKIPPWIYVLLLVLGWNELWTILTNPIYFIFTLLFFIAIYLIFALKLQGPVLTLINSVSNEVLKLGRDQLDRRLSPASTRNPGNKLKTL